MTRALDSALRDWQQPRNRILNPDIAINQEGIASTSSDAGYITDMWGLYVNAATASVTAARVGSVVNPSGSTTRLRLTVNTGKAVLGSADYLCFYQPIEGFMIGDFRFGGTDAKTVCVRFGFKGPAGTYSMFLRNGLNRGIVKNFTITPAQANTDTVQTFTIPGDTTGTWVTTATLGAHFGVAMIGTSGSLSTPDVWTAANNVSTAANTNGLVTGNVFELFDVGLYLGATPPPFEVPRKDDELRRCQRYMEIMAFTCGTATAYTIQIAMCAQKRSSNPTITLISGSVGTGGAVTAYGPATFVSSGEPGSTILRQSAANSSGAVDAVFRIDARL